MLINVQVEIPDAIIERVRALAFEMNGVDPSDQQLQDFFCQDVPLVYEQCALEYSLEDAVEQFFYIEESGLKL